MNILINASNLKLGGGIQVADSLCNQLYRFGAHQFTLVLSSFLASTAERIAEIPNVEIVRYNIRNSIGTLALGRDKFLDGLVRDRNIDVVLTVFGPSRWNPRVPHISGFAMSHLVMPDSPYFKTLHGVAKWKSSLRLAMVNMAFRRSTRFFYTENEYISQLLRNKWRGYRISTVTNYYNQIFDSPEKWMPCNLPEFNGTTILTISANYPHKNLGISVEMAKVLRHKHPEFNFRFVFTTSPDIFPLPEELKKHFLFTGKVDIAQCPSLYQQADIAFQPTLLECFTATYPEAMRMKVPLLTTDLEFARGLCGNAAAYYSPLDAEAAADAIFKISNDKEMRNRLIENGTHQLEEFDTFETRADKIISLCEQIVNN